MVVGGGESAADIVREISEVARSCRLLLRSYPFSIRRLNRHGVPADVHTNRMFFPYRQDSLPVWLLACFYALCWALLYRLGLASWWDSYTADDSVVAPTKDGLPVDGMGQSPRGAFCDYATRRSRELSDLIAEWHSRDDTSHLRKFATKNVSHLPHILSGRIQLHLDAVASFTSDGVVLKQGGFQPLDCLVMATGYSLDFPFLSDPCHRPPSNDVRRLFKHAFHPLAGHSLCFVGFARPTTGAHPAMAEMTARYFAQLVSGRLFLPPEPLLSRMIDADEAYESALFVGSPDLRSLVNPPDYMDSIASLLGCSCNPLRYALSPCFFLRLLTCTDLACRYRLLGPHASPAMARRWIHRALTSEPPLLCALYMLKKIFYLAGVVGTHDVIVDLRSWGIELTSRQNRFSGLKSKLFNIVPTSIAVGVE